MKYVDDFEILVNLIVIITYYQQINLSMKKKEFFQEMLDQPVQLTFANFLNFCKNFDLELDNDRVANRLKLGKLFRKRLKRS